MKTAEIRKQINAHRGTIKVAYTLRDDVIAVVVTKRAALMSLRNVGDDQASALLDDASGILYLDRA